MVLNKIKSLIDDECMVNIKSDSKNNYNYEKFLEYTENSKDNNIDNFIYKIKLADGTCVKLNSKYFDNINNVDNTDNSSNMLYNYTNNIQNQISMIKLFMAVYMSKKYASYMKLNENIVRFTFCLYNSKTHMYDKLVNIDVDKRILVDQYGEPFIIQSENMLDHLLLKAFIKMSQILEIDINDINVNSLVATCRGGKLYKMELDIDININAIDFNIDKLLNDAENNSYDFHNHNNNIFEKLEQCTWVTENIIRSISGLPSKPFNKYAQMIYNLYTNNNLLGITMGNSLFYIVTNMHVDQYGGLKIYFYNIFNAQEIGIDIETVMHCMNQIGLIVTDCI